jgi:AraC-like DNA-binding protein
MHSTVPVSGDAPPATFAWSLADCFDPYLLECYPPVALAAEMMGCSVRTLQRRLAAERTSYRDVVDKARCLKAMSQLRDDGDSITELALMLGYSEHSAFTRAFRRWTGTSPSEFREHVTQTPLPSTSSA